MTNEEVIKELENMRKFNYTLAPDEVFNKAIKALEHNYLLERRLKHLLQSEFIRSFDEVDARTKEYKRDIRKADYKNTGGSGAWEVQYFDNMPKFFICSNCKCRLSYRYNFCPCCGSDNRSK